VPTVSSPSDWDPLAVLVAVDTFVRRITESPPLGYDEIEERHHRRDVVNNVVNTLTVFEFDDEDKVLHFAAYLQQPAAASGRS
jgi:hypothetical protein